MAVKQKADSICT